jgi:excisionase family DNA binding protein
MVTDRQLAPVVPIGEARSRSVPRLAFSPDEVAESLGISRDLVDQLIRTGRLPSVKAGHRRLIGLQAIEAFLAGEDAS